MQRESLSLAELLPKLRALSRADKLRVMQFLISELAREEGETLQADTDYPVWTPYDAFEAAASLLEALKEAQIDYRA
jgi:hypothetical protein